MKFKVLKTVTALVVMCLASVAQAGIINTTNTTLISIADEHFGLGAITYDTDTGLEWLCN